MTDAHRSTLDKLLDASLYYGAAFGLFWSLHIGSSVLFFVALGTLVKFWGEEWSA